MKLTRIVKSRGFYYPQRRRGIFKRYWSDFYEEEVDYCLASCQVTTMIKVVKFKTKQEARNYLRKNLYRL